MKIISLSLFSILLCFSFYQENNAKIFIITTAYNRPDFIEWQHKTFKKFLKDDYEFKVFNDADNPAMEQLIKEACERFNIACIKVPQEVHNIDPNCHRASASFRHGEAIQFALNQCGFYHDDIIMTIDTDTFLIREFSIRDFLNNYDMMGAYIDEKYWIAPNFGVFNIPNLKDPQNMNFHAAVLSDGAFMEAGQQTQDYINNHPEIKWKLRGTTLVSIEDLGLDSKNDLTSQLNEMGYTNEEAKLIISINDVRKENPTPKILMDCDIGFYEKNIFLDYKHGSDWHGPNAAIKKKKDHIINIFFKSLLQ